VRRNRLRAILMIGVLSEVALPRDVRALERRGVRDTAGYGGADPSGRRRASAKLAPGTKWSARGRQDRNRRQQTEKLGGNLGVEAAF